jgi:translation initiation factor IF-1
MAKQEVLTIRGIIKEALSNAMFRIKLDDMDKEVISQASGKIRLNRIRLVEGDRVEVEFSPYDLDKGRISKRL